MTFGEKVKKARMEAGYTQEELAAIFMVSRAAVAKWESDRGMPDLSNLKMLSEILNTSVDALLYGDEGLDFSVIKKMIDLTCYGDSGKLSRFKMIAIKEKIIREVYPQAEILRLTLTKIKNSKAEDVMDKAIGFFALLLAGIPLFGTQEMGKMANSLGEQYFLVNDEKKQYFVLMTDEQMISRIMINPIHDKKFSLVDREFLVVGKVE